MCTKDMHVREISVVKRCEGNPKENMCSLPETLIDDVSCCVAFCKGLWDMPASFTAEGVDKGLATSLSHLMCWREGLFNLCSSAESFRLASLETAVI